MSGDREQIPQHLIDDANNDVSGVVRGYLPGLKKTGKNWSACCPFHKEKSASFTVNDAKGLYYCFGCGAGGDAVGFVREMNPGMSFRAAVESILGEVTLESSAVRRAPVVRADRCDLSSHAEDREKAADILSRCQAAPQHKYLMKNNTAPNESCLINGKGILMVPLVNNIGETVNVAAVLSDGSISYAAGNPSYCSTAILEPVGDPDGKTIICDDYAHAWRLWWAQSGRSKVLCAMSPDNLSWMLANCRDRYTHVGCDPSAADEHAEMGRPFIALPVDPYAKVDRIAAPA